MQLAAGREAETATGALAFVETRASSSEAGFTAQGAADGDRFSTKRGRLWKGKEGEEKWSWTASFDRPVRIGAILQVLGDDATTLAAAPLSYVWQVSTDGSTWRDLPGTAVENERRMYRLHRLPRTFEARHVRVLFSSTGGTPPAIREVEVYRRTGERVAFPPWFFSVSSENEQRLTTCHQFLDLARSCDGWGGVTAQYLWHGDYDLEVATAEPRPVCAFFTGSYRDWCEVDRSTWKGVETVLRAGKVPMWASCGGGQVFGILSDTGCDHPWDCPKCRDPAQPKLPIYGHIGLIDPARQTLCGDFSNNLYERGPTAVRLVRDDPVFAGLPREFLVQEYHCGQLEYVPEGWDLLVTKGDGGKTKVQGMRRNGTCIYATQFHIEIPGTPDVSQRIMSNFLAYATKWSAEHGDRPQVNPQDGARDERPRKPEVLRAE